MKPPPYCSSLQDGGGFLCLRFFVWRSSACGSGFGAEVQRMRSHGLECACWVRRYSRLYRTTQGGVGGNVRGFTGQRRRGSAPSAALGRLEDGAPASRARYAPRSVQLLTLSRCGRFEEGAHLACPVCASFSVSYSLWADAVALSAGIASLPQPICVVFMSATTNASSSARRIKIISCVI